MTQSVHVAGIGMIPFVKPSPEVSYPEMAAAATRSALSDAGIDYTQVQQAYVGYVYGDSTAGQRALYGVGGTSAACQRYSEQGRLGLLRIRPTGRLRLRRRVRYGGHLRPE